MKIQAVINLVSGVQNGGFVTVEKTSEAKMKKTGNPLRDRKVEKRSKFQVQVGCDLQKIEDKKAEQEGRTARKIGGLPWGEYVMPGLPIIKHNGNFYLRGFWMKGFDTSYLIDGQPATESEVKIIKQFSSSRPLDKSAPLCIKFDNIQRIAGGGKVVV